MTGGPATGSSKSLSFQHVHPHQAHSTLHRLPRLLITLAIKGLQCFSVELGQYVIVAASRSNCRSLIVLSTVINANELAVTALDTLEGRGHEPVLK